MQITDQLLRQRCIQNTIKHLRCSALPKELMSEFRCGTILFFWRKELGFVELGPFDKYFVKNTKIRGPAGKDFGGFSPRYS